MTSRLNNNMTPLEVKLVPVKDIQYDPDLNMRSGRLDDDFAGTLADVLMERETADLEPVILFAEDGPRGRTFYYIGDGNHRYISYRLAKRDRIPAKVYGGGREAAWRCALGANADQTSKPRTRKDLRRAVLEALNRLWFGADVRTRPSQQDIAKLCRTSQQTVSNILKLEEERRNPQPGPVARDAQPGEQMDFWEKIRCDYSQVVERVTQFRTASIYRDLANTHPREAIENLTAIADGLQAEYRELREHIAAIRKGVEASQQKNRGIIL